MATLGVKDTLKLKFEHVPTGRKVEFPAYLENLADMFASQWTAEDVYGRMDPITTFMNTRRAISLSWNVPANSFDDAKRNMLDVNRLMSFLYPLYSEKSGAKGATAINQGPLMRVSFGNLIRESTNGKGLLGYVNGFTFDPRIENGMFYQTDPVNGQTEYYPKTILLNFELNVLHEHELGFKKVGNKFEFRNKNVKDNNFPYSSAGANQRVGTAAQSAVSPQDLAAIRQEAFQAGFDLRDRKAKELQDRQLRAQRERDGKNSGLANADNALNKDP